jgi:hypothetical protein
LSAAATSMSVRMGVVIGMPFCSVVWSGVNVLLRWMRMPARRLRPGCGDREVFGAKSSHIDD